MATKAEEAAQQEISILRELRIRIMQGVQGCEEDLLRARATLTELDSMASKPVH
jgi:hypothetical protein